MLIPLSHVLCHRVASPSCSQQDIDIARFFFNTDEATQRAMEDVYVRWRVATDKRYGELENKRMSLSEDDFMMLFHKSMCDSANAFTLAMQQVIDSRAKQ